MALYRVILKSAFIVLVVTTCANAEAENADDGITVEVEEDGYQTPEIDPKKVYLAEHFDNEAAFKKRWVKSEAKKQGVDETIAKYDGQWEIQAPSRRLLKDDLGLVLTTEAKHAAIATLLDRPFEFKDKPFVVQYEVTMQEGQNCGGAYIKLLSKGVNTKNDLKQFHDQTPYTIMFGPDKCGNDNKLHFIFRHKNPKNGTIEEKHAKKPTQRLDDIYKDKEPHLYTLVVRPDNTFTIYVDGKEANAGSLLEDFTPPVNPPEEIDDPDDKKPEDWDEREKIVDPTATKPEDWDEEAPAQIVDPNAVKPEGWLDDEPEMIPDPEAVKPSDWEDEMDGEWEAPLVDNPRCAAAPGCGPWAPPLVPNPAYKGVWRAPLVPNPQYRGRWAPRRVPNPHYFRDDAPYKMTAVTAVGFELWSMSPQLLFDNLIITDDEAVAAEWAKQTYALKRERITSQSKTLWGRILAATKYKPGYWVMYAIYCAVPITLYVVYLLGRSREQDADAEIKKTDAVVEDDPHAEGEKDAEGEGDGEVEEEEPEPKEKAGKADLEGPVEEEVAESAGGGDGHRKRKPRKE
ncbi:calnexin isoform X1 [Zerene cesonia]|uniref:calnexin isoform X1 n=1 Tax=Zerene cesonia TaxID=33412 RepID=UPI0018E5295B|nr:calnexin isoform X1 [Zerene cesonia]XP_038213147.1 calnexin isoform X1 [Zerene cesonia]